ncbi:Regulatory protein MsrR [bacterium HR17]|uniref:Regulatory protein MsrR n=1 Tax=Candidatus Fervidibacter japonicus TaxID=2035412 RepID=A0A2H5XDU0_9BACT|nr:Regulatory protein MsrR [bacterium HR17]
MWTNPANEWQRRRRFRRLRRIALVAGLVVLNALACLAGVSVYLHRQGKATPVQRLVERVADWVVPSDYAFAGRDRLNILIVGADRDYDNRGRPMPTPARSDTILVASLSRDGTVALLSIPRDTLVRYNGRLHKINAVHAIGGPQELQKVLADEFGIDTHHFVQVTFDAFVKLVDLVGGVDLFVEYDMHYDDNWGNLHIHLQRGWHHLNGKDAIGYVRYRGKGYRRFCPKCRVKIEHWDPTGDLGRVQRQQKFLKTLAQKLLQSNMVTKLPRLVAIAREYLATDMDTRTMLSLANFARTVSLDKMKTATLPGNFARHPRLGSILIPDREKAPQVLADLLGPTFLIAQWEHGAGSIEGLLRVASRPERNGRRIAPANRTVGAVPETTETPEEQEPTTPDEGVPIGHEPVEVIPMPTPHSVAPPPPPVKPDTTPSPSSSGTTTENNPSTPSNSSPSPPSPPNNTGTGGGTASPSG